MKSWQLQEAKARLSELVREAQEEGPQGITVRGEDAAIVISRKDYEKLIGQKERFLDFMRSSPLKGVNLVIQRDKSLTRDIDL